MKDLINEKTQNDENTHSSKSKRGNQKLVNIEEQYEGDNDKTLLQVATDNGNVEALKVWFEQLKSLPVIEINFTINKYYDYICDNRCLLHLF